MTTHDLSQRLGDAVQVVQPGTDRPVTDAAPDRTAGRARVGLAEKGAGDLRSSPLQPKVGEAKLFLLKLVSGSPFSASMCSP